jgi:Haem-degrading
LSGVLINQSKEPDAGPHVRWPASGSLDKPDRSPMRVKVPSLLSHAGGSMVGAIGVSGAPGGDADEACAKAGIEAIQSKLDF